MFLGESTHTVDAKGRCFVPKRFQEFLDRDESGAMRAVLTRGFERCVFLFSEAYFREMVQRLATASFQGAKLRKIQRMFFANTHRVNLDSSGRVLIPEKLKQHAGLEREVVMVGAYERAEIWNKEAWESFEEASAGEFDELDTVLCGQAGESDTFGAPGTAAGGDPVAGSGGGGA